MIVTADHGNCETMVDPDTGGPHTAHTTNPVPVMMRRWPPRRAAGFPKVGCADLAPTLLELMEPAPAGRNDGEKLAVIDQGCQTCGSLSGGRGCSALAPVAQV